MAIFEEYIFKRNLTNLPVTKMHRTAAGLTINLQNFCVLPYKISLHSCLFATPLDTKANIKDTSAHSYISYIPLPV